jgi:hypothetical protein
MRKWSARIIRGKKVEELKTVEAQTHHEAYLAAIKKFRISIEQQDWLFVWAWPRRDGS